MHPHDSLLPHALGIASLALGAAALPAAPMPPPPLPPPNILFILIDDLGWGDIGVYGQKFIDTPNFDRLAAQGM
ncbi:MAG: sulfatase-like hydrolase/transferase, partial [Opitutaceae bacterium]|nr:sulfatase-like hydrolase/transferase [Opitutaceae bacterium]